MASSLPPKAEVQALTKYVASNALLNRQLSAICNLNGLKTTGVKNELQKRIIALINEVAAAGRNDRFQEIQRSITKTTGINLAGHAGPSSQPSYYPNASSLGAYVSHGMTNHSHHDGYGYAGSHGHRSQQTTTPSFQFKTSPFYSVHTRLGDVRTCEVMQQHRNSVRVSLKVQDCPVLQQCLDDPTMRVMVFCAAGNTGVQDITFPHQSELKVNGGDIKANLRGLKNKPGSTRPVDITEELRLKIATYHNNIEFTYALTTKVFYLVVYLCRTSSVPTLVRQISQGKRIPKGSVVQEIAKKAQDPDIVMSSQVVSLQCPLTRMRLETPCRALSCNHIQCFDATSYLQLQEQGPLWLCPICDKPAPFEQLAVDEYAKDILTNTSKSVEQVAIELDGKWSVAEDEDEKKPKAEESSEPPSFNLDDDDDDDDFVIQEVSAALSNGAATPAPRGMITPIRSGPVNIGTPDTGPSRETSSMPRAPTSNKRPIAQVIDLTLSSDDEEDDLPPQPPKKRQYLGTANSYGQPPLGL